MKTEIDLFGKSKIPKTKIGKLEKGLLKYDQSTFEERLNRLKYIQKIYPKDLWIGGDREFVYTFSEAKDCYVAGHFIATIILTQSFIEKILHQFFEQKGLDSIAQKGLDKMIKYAKQNNLVNTLILDKINTLRLKRNPFIHSKDWEYPHSISNRMQKEQTVILPSRLLESDATEAIQIMFFLITHKLK